MTDVPMLADGGDGRGTLLETSPSTAVTNVTTMTNLTLPNVTPASMHAVCGQNLATVLESMGCASRYRIQVRPVRGYGDVKK